MHWGVLFWSKFGCFSIRLSTEEEKSVYVVLLGSFLKQSVAEKPERLKRPTST